MQSKFEQLYDMYYDCVYRYIFVSVKNKWSAENITAIVFTKIFENKEKITEVEASKNWIFRIAHYTIIDFYRINNKINYSENFLDIGADDFGYQNIFIRDEFNRLKKEKIINIVYRMILTTLFRVVSKLRGMLKSFHCFYCKF